MTDSTTAVADPLRVAVSDGDSGFVQVLTKRLDRLGWEHIVLTGAVPVERLVAMRLGAFIVDLALLGPNAWPYLERVTTDLPALPVIVCTGQSTVAQRVRGLRLGADDWVTKPCHPEELIARVETVSRRRRLGGGLAAAEPVLVGEIEIRADQFQAFAHGRSIDLTRREFELIQLLAGAGGRVLEREEIYQRVWGYSMAHGDRSVDVFVRKLRSKLQRVSPDWTYIHTHFGVGYRFAAERVQASDEDADTPPADDVAVMTPALAPVPVLRQARAAGTPETGAGAPEPTPESGRKSVGRKPVRAFA